MGARRPESASRQHSQRVARPELDLPSGNRKEPAVAKEPLVINSWVRRVFPGNKLQCDNRRKCMVLSFSFLELGQAALSRDVCWFTAIVVRASKIQDAPGGWSQFLRLFLEHQLLGANGLSTSGVPLVLGDRAVMLFAKLTNLMSDGDGLRSALNWKGASGLKPSFKHHNVFMKDIQQGPKTLTMERGRPPAVSQTGWPLGDNGGGRPLSIALRLPSQDSDLACRREGYVEITCDDDTKFATWTNQEFFDVVDMLRSAAHRCADGSLTKAKFEGLEGMAGLNYNELGLLWSDRLRAHICPLDIVTYDWVHNELQDGVFVVECRAFVQACTPHGVTRAMVEEFLKDGAWEFPRGVRSKCKQLHRVFSEKRTSSADATKIKASCAEMLGVYGLLRHFFAVNVNDIPEVRKEWASFAAACQVLDIILLAKRESVDIAEAAGQLRAATGQHLRLHKAAYGTQWIKPKHHWQMNVPSQLLRDMCVLDAFVIERTHLRVKAIADHIRNTSEFERSTLAGVLTGAFESAKSASLEGGLLGITAPWPARPTTSIGDKMDIFNFEVAVDDVVLRGNDAGVVRACAAEAGTLFAFVEPLGEATTVSPQGIAFRTKGAISLWPAAELRHCVGWQRRADGSLLVLL